MHERAAFLFAEIVGGRAAGIEGTIKMDLHHRVEILIGHLVEVTVAQNAGVVYHRVDATEFLDPGFDHRARGIGIGDRAAIGNGIAPSGPDLFDDFLRRSFCLTGAFQGCAQIIDHHGGAFGGCHQGDITPDPTAGPGDQNDLSVKCFCHLLAPSA